MPVKCEKVGRKSENGGVLMKKAGKRMASFFVMLSILCSMIVPTVPISGAEVDQSKWITSGMDQ